MRIVIGVLVVVALLAASGVALLIGRQIDMAGRSQDEIEAQAKAKIHVVLVAGRNLPAGKKISTSDLKWQKWPEDALRAEYVSAKVPNKKLARKFVGSAVRRGIASGMPVTQQSVFTREKPGFMAGVLEPGMRAVAIDVTAGTGAAGFILPGDRVDVVLTHDIRKDFSSRSKDSPVLSGNIIRYTAETILNDIRVVGVDQKINDIEGESAVVKTLTLEVTPKQAEVLIVAKAMGDLSLTLRSLDASASTRADLSRTTDLEISPTLTDTFGAKNVKIAAAAMDRGASPPSPAPAKIVVDKVAAPAEATEADALIAAKTASPAEPAPPSPVVALATGSASKAPKPGQAAARPDPQPRPAQPPGNELAAALPAGTRAVSIPVSAVSGAAGFIQPGDHVDVILTHDVRKNAPDGGEKGGLIADQVIRFTAETIMRNVPVIAVDQKTADEPKGPAVARTVTLQVFPRQAEALAVAAAMGNISLSLRSPGRDAPGDPGPAFTSDVQVSPALSKAFEHASRARNAEALARKEAGAKKDAEAAKMKPVAPRPGPARARARVKVYLGGQPTVQEITGR